MKGKILFDEQKYEDSTVKLKFIVSNVSGDINPHLIKKE